MPCFSRFLRGFWTVCFSALIGLFVVNSCLAAYTVNYLCGDGTGETPDDATDIQTGAGFVPAANTCTPPENYEFDGWSVSGTNEVIPASTSFTWEYTENKYFIAHYAKTPCSAGQSWETYTCDLSDATVGNIAGSEQTGHWGARAINGATGSDYTRPLNNYQLAKGEWISIMANDTIKGRAFCSNRAGNHWTLTYPENYNNEWLANDSELIAAGTGDHCWCKISNSLQCDNIESDWVFSGQFSSSSCSSNCAIFCVHQFRSASAAHSYFRRELYNAVTRAEQEKCEINANLYSITYSNLLDATWDENQLHPASYTTGEEITIGIPTREGYAFAGWCDDAELTQNCTTEKVIPAGSTGDKTFYAKWTALPCGAGYHEQTNPFTDMDYHAGVTGYAYKNVTTGTTYTTSGYIGPEDIPTGKWNSYFNYVDASANINMRGVLLGRTYCASEFGQDGYDTIGTYSVADDVYQAEPGKICWCQAYGFIPTGEEEISFSGKWVHSTTSMYNQEACENNGCAVSCADLVNSKFAFRQALFTVPLCTANAPETYSITYSNMLSATWESGQNHPASYTAGETVVLGTPSREGYTFVAWCDDVNLSENCTGTKTISSTDTGNKEFYAKWNASACEAGYESQTSPFNDTDYKASAVAYAYFDSVNGNPALVAFRGRNNEVNVDLDDSLENLPAGRYELFFKEGAEGVSFYGMLYGRAQCSTTLGYTGNWMFSGHGQSVPDTISETPGNYCWCQLDGFTPYTLSGSKWVPSGERSNFLTKWMSPGGTTCTPYSCAKFCVEKIAYQLPERQVMYGPGALPTCKIKTYTISYELDGGEWPIALVSKPETYNITSSTINLPTPAEREGYTFGGWYDNNSFTGNLITQIPSGSYGNKTFYAKWTEDIVEPETCPNGYELSNAQHCDMSGLDVNLTSGTVSNGGIGYYAIDGSTSVGGNTTSVNYSNLEPGQWYDTFSYGTVKGVAFCSAYAANNDTNQTWEQDASYWTADKAAVVDAGTGKYCWCKITDFTSDNQQCHNIESVWAYVGKNNSTAACNSLCAYECGTWTGWSNGGGHGYPSRLRQALYNSVSSNTQEICVPATYTITYRNDNNENVTIDYTVVDTVDLPVLSDTENATFVGWCVNSADCDTVVSQISAGTMGDITLYAQWEELEFDITCINGDSEQTIIYEGGDTVVLPTPEARDNYEFMGWCEDLSNCENPLTGSQPSIKTSKTFYAKWVHAPCSNGEYLNNEECVSCPGGYTSNGATATSVNHCYKNWSCNGNPECPEHSVNCGYVGATSGTEYYGSVIPHCNISFGCQNGYTPQSSILSNQNVSVNADRLGSVNLAGNGGQNVTDLSVPGMWYTTFNYGKLSGRALCSAKSGADYHSFQWNGSNPGLTATENELTSADGEARYCWCHANEFTPTNEPLQNISTPWIMASDRSSASNCTSSCAQFCSYTVAGIAYAALGTESDSVFRAALYNSSSLINGTSRTYNAQNKTWSVTFPYGTASGVSLCSPTWADGYGSEWRVGHPDETTTGKNCWCKATNISTNDNSHQSMLTGYWVYSAFNSNNCELDCAESCADSIKTHRVVRSSSLRVWDDDNSCVLNNYTLTFINDDSVYDTLNYTVNDTISLPTLTSRTRAFAGWCENSENCANPLTGNQSNLTGDKTLYAKWSDVSCANGYHAQTNPLIALDYRSDGSYVAYTTSSGIKVSNEHISKTLSAGDLGTYFDTDDNNGAHGTVYGHAYCSNTVGTSQYEIADEIDTANSGTYCWCQATGFKPLSDDEQRISAAYVYFANQSSVSLCEDSCAANCAKQLQLQPQFRQSVYDSLNACALDSYTITYNIDGSTQTYPTQDYIASDTITLPTPKKNHYDFAGWCIDEVTCDNPVTEPQTGWTTDKTLYAQWTPKTYSITYNTNGGEFLAPVVVPESYVVNQTTTLPVPTKENNAFSGWYNNAELTGDAIESLPTSKMGNVALYAKWRPETYQITYIDNGTEITLPDTETVADDNVAVVLPEPSEAPEGQAFEGWCDSYDSATDTYTNCSKEKVVSAYESTTLYAKWAPATYSITYYDDDEKITDSDLQSTYTYGDTVQLRSASKPHYDFVNWHSDNELTDSSIVEEISSTDSSNQTLYAEYEPIDYTLSFNVNTDDVIEPITYSIETVQSSGALQLPSVPVFSGRASSSGWYLNSNYTGTPITELTDEEVGTTQLFANVSSDSCGAGYQTQNSSLAVLDSSKNVSKSTHFAYRDTSTEPMTVTNEKLPKIKKNNTWNGNWGVYFQSYGGTIYGESSCNSYTGGKPSTEMLYSSSSQTMSPANAGQNCWCRMKEYALNNSTDFSTTTEAQWIYVDRFNDSTVCSEECTLTCVEMLSNNQFYRSQVFGPYSICTPRIYTIEYENNGGTVADGIELPSQYTIVYHDVTIPDNLTKSNYTFGEWCENSSLSEGCANPKVIQTGSSRDMTLYAQWTPDVHYIQFNHGTANGRTTGFTGSMENQAVNYADTNIELTGNAFAIDGYRFKEWSCTATTNNGETYTGTYPDKGIISKYEYPSDMVCTAQWEAIEYQIIYNNLFNSVWPNNEHPTTFTIDSENIIIPVPTRDEYTLSGWCAGDENNCNELQKPYTIVSGTVGNVTLWANWEAATYNITYKNQIDDSEINQELSPATYTFGIETELPTDVDNSDRPHYSFDGWYTEVNGGEMVTTISDDTSGNQTFWAKWTAIPYTVTYYWDSNKEEIYTTTSYTVEDSNITPLPQPLKDHFRFDGWKDEGGNTIDEIITANGGNRELYATWTRTSCEDNNYLENGECFSCPVDYPLADGTTATQITDCYAICPSTIQCPEHSNECDYAGTVVENKQFYNAGYPVACDITFGCDTYYTPVNNLLASKDTNISGIGIKGYISADTTQTSNSDIYGLSNPGDWGASFVYGDVLGTSLCSATGGTNYSTAFPDTNTSGKSCWCRATGYTPVNDVSHTISESPWVLNTSFADTASCEASCASSCATNLAESNDYLREPMFNATCIPDVYDILYWDGSEQLNNIEPKKYTYGTTTILNNTSKSNYIFQSWHTDSLLNDEDIITEISATMHGNQNIYSKWSPESHKIIFDHGTAGNRTTSFTGSMEDQAVNYADTNIELTGNDFAIDGYTFKEWSCTATTDSGEDYTGTYANNGVINLYNYSSDMTCTAQWTANSYTLSYDCNGGNLADGKQASITVTYDADYELNSSICEQTYYTPTNWECTNNLDTTNPKWNITDDSTCVAGWTPTEYAIIYQNVNDNSLSPTSYTAFEELTVPETNPTVPEHFEFVGWCDEDGTNCTDQQKTIPLGSSGPKTFVAKWNRISCPNGYDLIGEGDNKTCDPKTFNISYIVDGEEDDSLTPKTYTFGNDVLLPNISKEGYEFIGWCDGAKKCKTKLTGTQSGWSESKTLYANWIEQSVLPTCSTGYKLLPENFANIVNSEVNGSDYYALGALCFSTNINYSGDACPDANPEFNTLDMDAWKVVFGYGTVYGTSLCSETGTGTPSENSGNNCWCNITRFKPESGSWQSATSSSWVLHSNFPDCSTSCPESCAKKVMNNSDFRTLLFNGTRIKSCVENPRYDIHYYNVNENDWPDGAEHRSQYTEEDATFTIGTPERDNYVFNGWCESYDSTTNTYNGCSDTKTVQYGSTGDKSFYAKWGCGNGYKLSGNKCVLEIYEITYHNTNDAAVVGNEENSTSYNILSGTVNIKDLQDSDDGVFVGWCYGENNCSTPLKNFSFESSRAEDVDLYAIWNTTTPYDEFTCTENKFLNIGGDTRVCLSTTKPNTSPSMAFRQNNKTYYLQMTKQPFGSDGLPINKNSTKKLNVLYHGDIYNVHDASVSQ